MLMANEQFRVNNSQGMRLRTEPVVSEETKGILLPNGQVVTKLGDSDKPDWWHISTNVNGKDEDGFSNRHLMVPVDGDPTSDLMAKTLAAIAHVAPKARDNYLQAIRNGGPLFEQHGITTGLRMAHFLAQAMAETGGFTVLREHMKYRIPQM